MEDMRHPHVLTRAVVELFCLPYGLAAIQVELTHHAACTVETRRSNESRTTRFHWTSPKEEGKETALVTVVGIKMQARATGIGRGWARARRRRHMWRVMLLSDGQAPSRGV